MESQPESSAQEKQTTQVPLTHPSPTPVPPTPRATPTAAAEESARSEVTHNSPVTADLPADKPTESPPTSRSASGSPEASTQAGGTSTASVVTSVEAVDGKMATVKPGYQSFSVDPKTFCQPCGRNSTTASGPVPTTCNLAVTSPTSKNEPIAGVMGTTNVGASDTKFISPPLRVVSPNSVPVKKRSAFRAELEFSSVDQCIQGWGGSGNVGNDVCEKSSVSNTGVENFVKNRDKGEKHLTEIHEKKKQENIGVATSNASINPLPDDSNSVARHAELQQHVPPSVSSHTLDSEITSEPRQATREATGVSDGKMGINQQSPSAVRSAGEERAGRAGEHSLETTVTPVTLATLGVTNETFKRMSTLKTVTTTAGESTSSSNAEDLSKPVSRSNRMYGGSVAGPPTQPCYPPLYLPSSCHVTLGRESGRAPKDGSKVHATTFVPDMGEFIPGPASSTREPLARVNRNGQCVLDGQTLAKASEHLKGFVQNSSKNLSPKESKKGVTRQSGHVDIAPSKIQRRDGKGSPPGDRTFREMVSPGGCGGGSRMTEAPAKVERRGERYSGIDGARKMRDIAAYGTKSPPGMKPCDLSVLTHHHAYPQHSGIGGSPTGQKSSSVSPRDRKPGHSRGVTDVKGVMGDYSDKQRQMWDWHLAAASQHGIFYAEPWKPAAGFGTARTSMITSHSSTLSTQESVLRSALLQSGAHNKHGTGTCHTTTTAMVSPKMTTAPVESSVSKAAGSVSCTPRQSKREELAKKAHLGKVNFGELGSGRGTPNSRSGEGTPARNPPVGIALIQQRPESEKKMDARGSTGISQRDRPDDRRHHSRSTFSPHRDVRSADSHREHRPSSNSSQPSRGSPHNQNLVVTGGSTSLASHAPDFLAHHGAFLPSCYSRFPAGHHSPSQPLWLPQPYALPTAHGSSPLTSSYQDVPLPGNVGLQAREGIPSRPLMMFQPHLSATEGALHGLGTWPPQYLLSTPLHPQLGGLNPSLYAAPFAHLPSGGPAMGQHVPLLPSQTDAPHPSDVHAIFQQQQEAVLNWYRAMDLHRRGAYPAMTDTTHPPPHHGTDRTRRQSGGGRKSSEGKSEHDKKQLKSETQPQDSCGRTSREAVEEKVTQQTTPSIIPPFIPVSPHGSVPLFYPSHTIPYLLDPTKRHLVPSHSPSTTAKVEKKDAGTSSHSPASRPSSRERPKPSEAEAKPLDGSLKTACVQTLPPDKINQREADSGKIDLEKRADVGTEETEKMDSETLVVEDAEDKHLRLQKVARIKEDGEVNVEEVRSRTEPSEKDSEADPKGPSSKEEEQNDILVAEDTELKEGIECAPSEALQGDQGTQSERATEAVQLSDSDSWIANYPSCLEGQRRESLITSVMSTTQSVASKIEAVDQEQLAAIEGIALLSEVAEQKTFEAICNRQDDKPDVPDPGVAVDEAEKLTVTPESNLAKDVSGMQPLLSVSINTEEMKLNQLAELQRKYKERKKEYDKLQRKKEKKEKNETAAWEQTKKRGPGRPRKRKNSLKSKKNEEEQHEESTPRIEQPRMLQSSADVLLEAAASLEEEEPTTPPIKKKKKEKKKSRPRKDPDIISKEEMSTSSIQSSADVLLEAAASLEHPPPPVLTKKRKKEKKDKKMKYKREIISASGKDLKKKKKKLSRKKEAEESLVANGGKTKKKNKHSSSEMGWSAPALGGLNHPSTGRKKLSTKGSEKKKKGSKVKSSILPDAPEAIDLPAPEGASLPMYTEAKMKSSKNGLSISHIYGDSSDSDDENSSHCSFNPVPKGLALLASTAELSSGSSTPVKRPSKKLLNKRKPRLEDSVAKKRALLESTAAAAKKLKLSKKREKLRLQKTLKKGRKLNPQKTPQKSPRGGGGNVDETPPKFDAEMWSRRRSERIFLNDASPQQSREVSPQEPDRAKLRLDLGSPSKTKVESPMVSPIIGTVLNALKTDPFQMRQKFSQMSDSEDDDMDDSDDEPREAKLAIRRKASRDKLNALMNEANIDSDESNSDAEDMPLSSLVDSEPAPRICNLRIKDLVEGQDVLVPIDNLFYEGKVHPIRPPDVYGVVFESRRGNRPHVYSQEQILEDVIADVKPNSVKYLPEGTRICAYWSQQFNCLYPGTVVKGAPNVTGDKKMVTVEFDDGDSGRIPLSHMRMLPQDYPLISDLGSSSIPLEKKLRQTNTETSCNMDKIREAEASDGRKRGPGKGKARKGKSISEVGDDEVFLPDSMTPVKKPRGRKPKVKTKDSPATKASQTPTDPITPVKKGRGRPRKIRLEETQPRKKGRPPKKQLSGSVTLAKKINKFYAGRKIASQQKAGRLTKPGARPRGRPPGSKSKVKGQTAKAKSPTKVRSQPKLSPEILDPARAAMMRYTGPDDSEDAGTLGESDIASTIDEEEVGRRPKISTKKRKGSKSSKTVYLPERQFWRWLGNATQRKGSKGKAKKVFYKAIVRGKEVIRVNECAVFLSTGRPHLPYIGRIESMWESWGGIMVVRVKWCYHPEETNGCAANIEGKMALYQSSHVDENDIQTISHKCEVLSREEYKLRAMGKIPKDSIIDNEDVYYLAGTYDPTTGRMATFQ